MIVYRCPVCRQTVGLGVVNPVDHPPTCCRYPERIDADGTRRPGPTHRPTTMHPDGHERPLRRHESAATPLPGMSGPDRDEIRDEISQEADQ